MTENTATVQLRVYDIHLHLLTNQNGALCDSFLQASFNSLQDNLLVRVMMTRTSGQSTDTARRVADQ